MEINYTTLLSGIIGGVDLYLIGMVLLIFSFGIYELSISKIDIARSSESYHTLLEISNLDDLKNKIIKVIIMVLIVSFFQRVLSMKIDHTPWTCSSWQYPSRSSVLVSTTSRNSRL